MKDWQGIFCPIERTAAILADHYIIVMIRDLATGPKRFGELQAAGINPRTLSARLRQLQDAGLIERHPPHGRKGMVSYRLTDQGQDLMPLLDFLRDYGQKWFPKKDMNKAANEP